MNIFFTENSKICLFIGDCANENLYEALNENPEIITSQEVFRLHLHHSFGKNLFHFQVSDNAVNNEVFSIHSVSSASSRLSYYLIGCIILANGFCSYTLFHLDLSFPESPLAVKPHIRFNI